MSALNEKYSLDNFVVGKSNKFAYAAAQAIMESPGDVYNPLVVFGETGTGKTHLLNAIANYFKEQNPDMNILYMTAEEMIIDIIESIRSSTTKEMREKYNNADVLIVDDIQRIAGKEATQDEFFHLYNIVHGRGKQIVLSLNMDPHKIEGLEGRILSRIMWGLVADMDLPDIEMKKALINRFAESYEASLSPSAVDYVANAITSNTFELEGFVKEIMLYAKTNNMPPEKIAVVELEKLLRKKQHSSDHMEKTINDNDILNGMHEINDAIVNETVRNMVVSDSYDGVKTGFGTLDRLINGFGKGQLIVLGARPAMGKTTFACSVIDNVCIKGNKSCVYFSPAYSKESIVQRLIRIHGGIRSDENDLEKASDSAADIVDSSLWIDDTPAIYVDEMIQKCRELREIRDIDLIVVDYLQLVSDIVEKENSTLAEQKQIIGKLKYLAEECNCAILVLSQLNRSAEKRKRHFPIVADFPTHTALGKFADVILLLYREFYYYMREDRNHATLYIARSKNKSGISTSLRFEPDIPSFQEYYFETGE